MSILSQKSDAELKALLVNSEAKLLVTKEKTEKIVAEAKKILENREKHNAWAQRITSFTESLLKGITTANGKPLVEVSMWSDYTEAYIRKTRGFAKIVSAISEKFDVTIKFKYDDGGSDAGGWCDPQPSVIAIITFGRSTDPEAEDATITSLLKKIEEA